MSDDIMPSSMLGVDQLATALAKAQKLIHGAEKSRTNPAFKSKYATLADVWDACRDALTDNGLSVVQLVRPCERGVAVETRLLHCSGQSLSSTLEIPCEANAQKIGSAITYGRRYGLAAMVGVAPDEDDDGSAASQPRQEYRREEPRPQHREPARPAAPQASEREIDSQLQAAVKDLKGILPEVTVDELRVAARVPDRGAKLTIDQKQILLRTVQQRLRTVRETLEGDPPPPENDE